MTMVVESVEQFEPFSPEILADPCAAMQRLLAEAPVFHHAPTNAYYVLPYAEGRAVLGDWETYSNVKVRAMPVRADLRDRIPEHYERVGQLTQSQLSNTDPPDHTPRRRAAQKTFTHKRVRELEPRIARISNDVIDGLADRGTCDLMQDYAVKVTLQVIATLLGVPGEMRRGLHEWIDDVFRVQAPVERKPEDVTIPDDELVATYERLWAGYRTYSELLEQRLAQPGDDLASAMLVLRDEDGRRALSNDNVLGLMLALTAAGTDTTANLIVNMVRYFTRWPEQLQRLQDEPQLWDNAVAEGLRLSAIAFQKYRISTASSEILGMAIPAGARVAVSVAAANSDPSVFADPLQFDVGRPNASEHLGLGRGRHFCLGAPVVLREARIALQTLYARLPGLTADLDQELEFMPALETRAILSQRVSWDRDAVT
jgi:cytochrome P450